MTSTRDLLLAAFDKHSVSPELRAGIAALAGGESDLNPHTEISYRHTANDRIRGIFQSRMAGMTDAGLDALKADDQAFFERAYGASRTLGNLEPGDGYKYRGRGIIQLTGKANYERYGRLIGVDLVTDPDRENEPEIAVETAVVYMLDRYKGGGWDHMKSAVGNSFGNVDQRKNKLFADYLASGEWNAAPEAQAEAEAPAEAEASDQGGTSPAAAPGSGVQAAVHMEPVEALRGIQRLMQAAGQYQGRKIDGDFREKSLEALDALVRASGRPSIFGKG